MTTTDPRCLKAACDRANAYWLDRRRPPNTYGVRIEFAATATRIIWIKLATAPFELGKESSSIGKIHEVAPTEEGSYTRLEFVTWEQGSVGESEDPTALTIEWDGEPPHIVSFEWIVDPPDGEPMLPTPVTGKQVYAWRRQVIETVSRSCASNYHPAQTGLRKRMLFFLEFDMRTQPALLDDDADKEAITAFRDRLTGRMRHRLRHASKGQDFDTYGSRDHACWPHAKRVSRIIYDHWKETFPDDGRLLALDDCFESFVCGDLSIGKHPSRHNILDTHGAPNSFFYLHLAEAALFLAHFESEQEDGSSERADFWTKALSTFVRTAEVYVQLYWNGGCRRTNAYGYRWLGKSAFTPDQRRRLREAYGPRTDLQQLRQHFNTILLTARRDDVRILFP
ncbi:MAG: hypothetical protein ACE37K_04620 [Planctomycetota bacterium]